MFWQKETKYQPVDSGDDVVDQTLFKPSPSRLSSWIGLISVFLSLICLVEGVTLMVLFNRTRVASESQLENYEVNSFEKIHFIEDVRFKHLHTVQEVEWAWSVYDLPNAGFVHISNPETFDLQPNDNVVPGMNNVYMISAFHQLHCLQELQKAFVQIERNNDTNSPNDATHMKHASHCFNYLRQGVLCAGDMALEGPDPVPVPGQSPLRGWGSTHSCRSWDGVLDWRDEHAVPTNAF